MIKNEEEVKGLSLNSHKRISLICDYCGKEYEKSYRSIIRGRKSINKDSCKNCVGNKCAEITRKKRRDKYILQLREKCNYNGYELLSSEDEIINNTTYIRYRCPMHGEQRMRVSNFLSGRKCPDCNVANRIGLYRLDSKTVALNISKFGGTLLNPEDYIGNSIKNLRVICPECKKEFITSYRNFVQHNGQVCSECSNGESLGEKKIRHYLEDNNISFKQHYWFSDCRDKNPLPFDFYIVDYNMIIEFDGRQHFDNPGTFFTHSVKSTKKHDEIKNKYCKNKGINIIRIPYWDYLKIDKILEETFNNLHKDIV